jgi:hypothetical protein
MVLRFGTKQRWLLMAAMVGSQAVLVISIWSEGLFSDRSNLIWQSIAGLPWGILGADWARSTWRLSLGASILVGFALSDAFWLAYLGAASGMQSVANRWVGWILRGLDLVMFLCADVALIAVALALFGLVTG